MMKYVPRTLGGELRQAAKNFPAVILTGPRRAGKTTLLRRLFARARYVLLEDPDLAARANADPRGFLAALDPPLILDEIQHVPALFNYIRTRIDAEPRRTGRWLLTGSQESALMQGVAESMAGRAAVFQLLPLSGEETDRVSLRHGGFPEVLARPAAADTWFRSYVLTYLERDIRSVSAIRRLLDFRRFLGLLASRCGQILNRTALAAPLGVSVPTISEWLNILEVTGQILLVPPFFENFGKRLIKSPKLYFVDSGLACHLLGISDQESLRNSPFLGPLFEGYIASEIVKHRLNRGRARGLYFFRDQQGLEVDFVLDEGNRRLLLLEAKATGTPRPGLADTLVKLASATRRYSTRAILVHQGRDQAASHTALRPGVEAWPDNRLHQLLSAAGR